MRKPLWQWVPPWPFERSRKYGPWIADAYRHKRGYLLLHEKWRSRHAEGADKMGAWVVYDKEVCLGRKSYYYPPKTPTRPPTEWANRVIRQHEHQKRDPS